MLLLCCGVVCPTALIEIKDGFILSLKHLANLLVTRVSVEPESKIARPYCTHSPSLSTATWQVIRSDVSLGLEARRD